MDGMHFDDLARSLARATSRRRVLRGIAAGALAALGLSGAERARAAACREAGRLCTQNGNCCSGFCDAATHKCGCPLGTEICQGVCKTESDYQNDPNNCGGCQQRCTVVANSTTICNGGNCDFVCNAGFGLCGGGCCPAAQTCCNDVCCAAGEACITGVCATGTTCLGLDVFCDPNNNQCCQDDGPAFCEATSTCHTANPGSDPTCCHRTGGLCTDTCDCCDFQLCRNSACCRVPNIQCDADDQCCGGVCCNGVCCHDFQACCNGACQAETEPCSGTVPIGGSCTATTDCVAGSGLTCADGGVDDTVVCGNVCCTSTVGASCAPNADGSGCRCCGSVGCGCPESATCNASNVVCGGLLADCAIDSDCLSGLCALSGGPSPNCCHDLGGFCRAGLNSSCCGTIGCGTASNAVCGGPGAPCTAGAECVSGTCDSGFCT